MRSIARIVVLLLVSFAAAAVTNAVRPAGVKWFPSHDEVKPPPPEPILQADISREKVLEAVHQGTLILDARSEQNYNNAHIPGAMSFPSHYVGDDLAMVDQLLEQVRQRADITNEIIVYCGGGECDDSVMVFNLLTQTAGFQNVRIYHGGWKD